MKQVPAIISMVLLVAFLVPYLWKIKEVPLLILLVFGVFLAVYDFYVSNKKAKQRVPQQPSYKSETT
jgi:mannose/fructose/N-acetylgalactosamine-specific phosphotransferase system component IIC